MKRLVLLFCILLFSLSAFAGKITYSIDPSTATPEGATVVNRNGESTIFFKVSSFEEGMTFTFTIDMKAKGDGIYFPVNAQMNVKGNKKGLEVSFNPETVTFENTSDSVSTVVTTTLPQINYDKVKKIKVKIKAKSEEGKGLGNGAGVKIVIIKASSYEEFLEMIKEDLLEDSKR